MNIFRKFFEKLIRLNNETPDHGLLTHENSIPNDPRSGPLKQIATLTGHDDPKAICNLTDKDLLATMARSDPTPEVRRQANCRLVTLLCEARLTEERQQLVTSITDQSELARLVQNSDSGELRKLVLGMMTDREMLLELVKTRLGRHPELRKVAAKRIIEICDQAQREKLATDVYPYEVRMIAIPLVSNKQLLSHIILEADKRRYDDAEGSNIIEAAISALNDNELLYHITKEMNQFQGIAVGKIDDLDLLQDLALNGKHEKSRWLAAYRLIEKGGGTDELWRRIAEGNDSDEIRLLAAEHIKDLKVLMELVRHGDSLNLRCKAVHALRNIDGTSEFLLELAVKSADGDLGYSAVERISDVETLKMLALEAKAERVRCFAVAKLRQVGIESITSNEPVKSPESTPNVISPQAKTMSNRADILRRTIVAVDSGELVQASAILRESAIPIDQENAMNCMNLAIGGSPQMIQMLSHVLRKQLETEETFGG